MTVGNGETTNECLLRGRGVMDEGAFTAVLILFCLAVLGASDWLARRSDFKFRTDMEWRVRAAFYKEAANLSDDLIERARQKFYKEHNLKPPRRQES